MKYFEDKNRCQRAPATHSHFHAKIWRMLRDEKQVMIACIHKILGLTKHQEDSDCLCKSRHNVARGKYKPSDGKLESLLEPDLL